MRIIKRCGQKQKEKTIQSKNIALLSRSERKRIWALCLPLKHSYFSFSNPESSEVELKTIRQVCLQNLIKVIIIFFDFSKIAFEHLFMSSKYSIFNS